MNDKCVLFDLDGTLVTTGNAGQIALERAFEQVHGLSSALWNIDCSGKTDPAIVREIFKNRLNLDCTQLQIEVVRDKYLELLPQECARSEGYKVMQGIPELIALLAEQNIVMGLGTGNWEPGARIKLERSGLNSYFSFGGYGSDSEDRPELLRKGLEKACALLGKSIHPDNVFVVGDTSRDILAARAAGFQVIAVATGGNSSQHLAAHEPDHLFKDFSQPQHAAEIILNH